MSKAKSIVMLKYAFHPDYADTASPPEKVHYEQDDFVELGYDLFAAEDVDIPLGDVAMVPTGLVFDIEPHDFGYFIKDRGGVAAKKKLSTRAGVVEASYRGQLFIVLKNDNPFDYRLRELIVSFNTVTEQLNTIYQRMKAYPKVMDHFVFNALFAADAMEDLLDRCFKEYPDLGVSISSRWRLNKEELEKSLGFIVVRDNKSIANNLKNFLHEARSVAKFLNDVWNTRNVYKVKIGDKIAQMVLVKAYKGYLQRAGLDEISESPRGTNCLGSSGSSVQK